MYKYTLNEISHLGWYAPSKSQRQSNKNPNTRQNELLKFLIALKTSVNS